MEIEILTIPKDHNKFGSKWLSMKKKIKKIPWQITLENSSRKGSYMLKFNSLEGKYNTITHMLKVIHVH